jgi:hypothetical protein
MESPNFIMGFAFPLHKFVSGENWIIVSRNFRFHVIIKFKGCIVIKSSICGTLLLLLLLLLLSVEMILDLEI